MATQRARSPSYEEQINRRPRHEDRQASEGVDLVEHGVLRKSWLGGKFGAHTNNAEYINISSIETRLYLLTRLIMDIAAGKAGIAAPAAR